MRHFVIYLVISIVITFPLILHMGDHLPGHPMDAFIYMWNVDEFWLNVFSLQNPFYTHRVFYPIGSSLAFHTLAPFVSLFALPFLNNLVLYMNLLVIVSLALAALAMSLLTSYLTNNKTASFISGLIYGFSPIMVSYIISQHYYFAVAAIFLPLAVLFLLKYFRTSQKRNIVYYIITFWASFFTDYQLTILMIIISGFVCLTYYKKLDKSFFIKLVAGILIPLLLLFVFVFQIDALIDRVAPQENLYPTICSTSMAGFIMPSEHNPIIGELTSIYKTANNIEYNLDTPSYFLGWGILVPSLIWLWRYRSNKDILLFAVIGLAVFLFSLGPQTIVFQLFSKLPFMSLIDCPQRFPIGTQLALAGIAGIGFNNTLKKKNKALSVAILLGILAIEYGTWNIPINKVEIPEVYTVIKKSNDNKSVLELPSGITESKGGFGYDWSIEGLNSKQLYWQTYHQKPRVGGYLSRIPKSVDTFFRNEPLISDLTTMTDIEGKWSGKEFSNKDVQKFLDTFNLGYIVLSPNDRQEEFVKVVEEVFSGYIELKEEKDGYRLYVVRALPPAPTSLHLPEYGRK